MKMYDTTNTPFLWTLLICWVLCSMPSFGGELMTVAAYALIDSDGDGVPNVDDNAPEDVNPDQRDDDGDLLGLVIDPDDDDETNGGAVFSASIGGPYSVYNGDDLMMSNITAIYTNSWGPLINYYEFYFDFDDDTVWDYVAAGASPITISNTVLQSYNLHTIGSHSVDVKAEALTGVLYMTLNYEVVPEQPSEMSIYPAVEIAWTSVSGLTYQTQYSTNLVVTNWFDMGPTVIGNGGTNYIFDSTRDSEDRFYRVIIIP